jgi:hypothetical protein
MTNGKKTLSIALAFVAASAATSSAAINASAFRPRLIIFGSGGQSDLRFSTHVSHLAPATAEIDLYVPAGYTPTLTQSIGTEIGTVRADAEDRGLTAPFTTGSITVADPAAYTKSACDSAGHSAVWLATLKSSATTFVFPIFARALAGQPTELHWCFAKRDPKLATVSFDLYQVFNEPRSGSYVWDARSTPYDPDTGNAVVGNQVSSLATVRLPQVVALHVSYSHKTHTYRIAGQATEDGKPVRGVVRLFRSVNGGPFITNRTIGGIPKLTRTGSFSYSGRLSTKKSVRFRAHFIAAPPLRTNCGKDVNGVPCVSSSSASWEKDSNTVRAIP